jgi:hypothetical protein
MEGTCAATHRLGQNHAEMAEVRRAWGDADHGAGERRQFLLQPAKTMLRQRSGAIADLLGKLRILQRPAFYFNPLARYRSERMR